MSLDLKSASYLAFLFVLVWRDVGLLGPGWDAGSAANWMFYQLMVYRQCSWHSHPPGWVLHIKRWKNTEMSNKRSGEKGSQNHTDISFYFFQWHLGQPFQSCPFPTLGIFRQYGNAFFQPFCIMYTVVRLASALLLMIEKHSHVILSVSASEWRSKHKWYHPNKKKLHSKKKSIEK